MNKSLLEKLLDFYHISYEEYQELTKPVTLDSFCDGHRFDDIDKAVSLVKEVINNKGKIVIYGDYDADGIMGTSILTKMFQYLDVVVSYYIPNRYQDGYGITLKHAQEFIDEGFELVITVDNGISAFEPIKLLKDNGVKVLILDHHEVQETVPNADAICHPTYSHFGLTASSGAFTAFIYSISLLGRVDKYLATLASISLISDMMPLLDYNRNLLRAVFNSYKPGEFLPIDLLADGEKLDETVIGMKVAPRINSIGRLCEDSSIGDIVKYFVSDDRDFVLNYFSHICDVNEERKNLTKQDSDNLNIESNQKAIVLLGDFKEGMIGLIANSIVNKYHVPTVVLCKSIEGLKGSARSPEGYNIVKIFNALSHLLVTFGGHALAGGCSLKEENFEAFRQGFIDEVSGSEVVYEPHPVINLAFSEVNFENYELIQSFAPFGESWEAPNFMIKHVKTDALTFSRDEKHIVTKVSDSLKLIGFGFSKSIVRENTFINIIGTIKKGSFYGRSYLEFSIRDIEPYI
ncbi:MAG: DHH family phosphoesterase [Bacilli bacterium]|nr:DHH family phosphoesterase [Bacilli bacterium]